MKAVQIRKNLLLFQQIAIVRVWLQLSREQRLELMEALGCLHVQIPKELLHFHNP